MKQEGLFYGDFLCCECNIIVFGMSFDKYLQVTGRYAVSLRDAFDVLLW